MAGDFNEESQNKAIQDVMETSFTDLYSLMPEDPFEILDYQKYPKFTTFKYRDAEGYVKRTIDYIFVNKSMEKNISIIGHIQFPE